MFVWAINLEKHQPTYTLRNRHMWNIAQNRIGRFDHTRFSIFFFLLLITCTYIYDLHFTFDSTCASLFIGHPPPLIHALKMLSGGLWFQIARFHRWPSRIGKFEFYCDSMIESLYVGGLFCLRLSYYIPFDLNSLFSTERAFSILTSVFGHV